MQEIFFIVRTFFYICVMNELISTMNQNIGSLAKSLPVRPTLEIMQEGADILLAKGLLRIEEILETAQDGDLIIKAVNTAINFGRFFDKRQEVANSKSQKLIVDSQYRLKIDEQEKG